jgi:hypothetical protein
MVAAHVLARQHTVQKLREIGIQPDALLCRAQHRVPDEEKEKISLFTNVPEEIKRRVDKAAKILELSHLLDRKPRQLSGDQRQDLVLRHAHAGDGLQHLRQAALPVEQQKGRAQPGREIGMALLECLLAGGRFHEMHGGRNSLQGVGHGSQGVMSLHVPKAGFPARPGDACSLSRR